MKRKISKLIAKDFLYPSKDTEAVYGPGFCMHIQIVPKKQFDSLSFGKHEGIRVFIQSENSVIAAIDFLFKGQHLKLSYVHQGPGLKLLLTIMNKLEKKYAYVKEACYAELIYFLLSPGPYILIKSGNKKQFYHSKQEKLLPISADGLKREVNKILAQRPENS